MRKIYSFSDFSSLYEADAVTPTEASKLYDQTLGLILTTALNAYTSELDFPIKSYDANIDADVAAIKSTPILDKPGALKTIMGKVQKAAADNKSEGAKEAIDAWVAAGSKAVDALVALINQYKDQPDELKHINDSINSKVDEFLENLIDSSKDNTLKADVIAAKESYEFEGAEEISEAMDWLKGKKGMIEDVAKQITLVSAKLANLAETPGMASSVTSLQAEVSKIAAEMGALLDKKNKEIDKEDIKKAAARLAEIPTEADKMAEKMLKQDATNKEASSILVQAFGLVQTAKNLEKEYLNKKEEAKQKETAAKIKVTLTVPTIDYTPEETKNVNPEVKKFQELVVDKFGKIKAITSLPQYTKMGTDGKFGPNTRDIVKVLKKGFGLTDTSGDITKELVDEIQIQADTIKESVNTRIFKFSDFINLSEAAFDSSVAIEYAKSLPTYKPTSSSRTSGYSPRSSSGSSILFKEGSKGPEVAAIQNAVGAKDLGTEEYENQTFGPKTKEAVMAWQKANGLKDDGIVGIGTIKKMAEIKNLGKWTASMISKLAGSEVKTAEVKTTEVKSTGAETPIIQDSDIQKDVDTLVDDLDGVVDSDNLNSILEIIKKYVDKRALGDDDKTVVEAIPRLMLLYKRDEDGNTLYDDIESVGLKTLPSSAAKTKKNIINLVKPDLNKPNGDI